jgi:hypothetical protein
MSLGLAVVCALAFAAQAVAHNFTASRLPHPLSEAEPGQTSGKSIEGELTGEQGERSQRFKFGVFEIQCAAAAKSKTQAEGAVTWSTHQTLSTEIRFTKCLTKAHFGSFTAGLRTGFNVNAETHKSEPIKFVYHVNGFAEFGTGETSTELEVGSGEATFGIAGKVCRINWPAQIVPAAAEKNPAKEFSSVTYSNEFTPNSGIKSFPSGEQQHLIINNNLKGMLWSYEGGQCIGEGGFEEEAKATEGKTALYTGVIEETLKGGNLGFE